MGSFTRETFEKKNIVTQDNLSVPGVVTAAVVAGDVVAFDKAAVKWVKFVPATHGDGTFALGVAKEDAAAGEKTAILKQGIVNAKEVSFSGEVQNLLMINGIVVL